MKDSLEKLIRNSHAKFDWYAFKKLDGGNLDSFITDLEALFTDPLFNFNIERVVVSDENNLPEAFVVLGDDAVFVRHVGSFYVASDNSKMEAKKLIGCEIAHIEENPKRVSSKEFIEIIFSLYPKINFALLLTAPLILVPAFYANLFNTRLIFNNMASTLLFVTIAFLVLLGSEYLLKKFIKNKHIDILDGNALKIERYMLSIIAFFKQGEVLSKVRMIESNRKVIWENISGIIIDVVNLSLIIFILFLFAGSNVLVLLCFYTSIMLFSIYMRYRNYKIYIELEAAQQDLLLERISYYKNRMHLKFFDAESVLNNFETSCKKSFSTDHDIAVFNFNWDEFVRLTTFLSSFVLFMVIFFSAKEDSSIFNVLIALLILNGRAASSIVSLVTKSFFVLVSTFHLNLALKDTFDALDEKMLNKGFKVDDISKITLKNINLMVNHNLLVSDINISLTKGNIYGFSGDVGSGKSTLMAAIVQHHKDYTGDIIFNNFYNAENLDKRVFSSMVAFIDPSSDFIRGSIYSNFYLRGNRNPHKIAEICKSIFTNMTIDYEFIFQKDITSIPMSTGQKRKLILFMSLNKERKLIILDEAFINLSYVDIALMLTYIQQELRESIVLIVTHDRNILSRLDNVFQLSDKKLAVAKTSILKVPAF
ncbi:MAG: ATP-binding cassette domain-containing protein [Gammaproteobacteria bacterium]|nr:ATP-binding cassette domain-containing protein [Gammaproteobacteria bacterium]